MKISPLLVVLISIQPFGFVGMSLAQAVPAVSKADAADNSSVPLSEAPLVKREKRGAVMVDHRVKRLRSPKRAVNQPDPVVQSETSRPFGAASTLPVRSETLPKTNGEAMVGKSDRQSMNAADPARHAATRSTSNATPTLDERGAASAANFFPGIGSDVYTIPGVPADTTGAAGKTQYVQWVNEAFAVFDKASGQMHGPIEGRYIWKGFPRTKDGSLHPCEKYNDGDPVVAYDRIRDRWLLSQFAVTNGPPYYECIAVSASPDALGSYHRYAFKFDKFDDYPKFSIWPDAYYATFNMFDSDSEGNDVPIGGKACAFNKIKMEVGDPTAEMICFDTASGGLLPSDFDGPSEALPQTGAYFLNFTSNTSLNLWILKPNWNSNPAKATFSGPTPVPVPPFTVACGDAGSCIPQKASDQRLESLGDRLLFRIAYRGFSDHESIVVLHSVQVPNDNGSSRTGIRWYEFRDLSNGSPTVYQKSTYAPNDGLSRWMGSAAMDRMGNILIGYSVSGPDLFPSIRYAGRLAGDPLDTLSTEVVAFDGQGSQGVDRWGDYSSVTLDPTDNCTFWLTTEYLKDSGAYNWRTHIRHLQFPNCKQTESSKQ